MGETDSAQPELDFISFLSFERGCIERTFSVQHFLMMGPKVTITRDASPYGMGATLQVDGAFTEFFAIPVSSDEAHILDLEEGSKSQQTLEALCGLIALRLWCAHWQGQRAVLQVRSDNVGALNLFSVLKGSSKALTLIASEFAIDLGHAEFRPDLLTHLPGVTNQICDVLSRRPKQGLLTSPTPSPCTCSVPSPSFKTMVEDLAPHLGCTNNGRPGRCQETTMLIK